MKDNYLKLSVSLPLYTWAALMLLAVVSLSSCALMQGAVPVKPKGPDQTIAVVAAEIADLYDFNVQLTLPVVEGAVPPMSMEQGRTVRDQLDRFAAALETSKQVWESTRNFNSADVDEIRRGLLSVRALLERAQEGK